MAVLKNYVLVFVFYFSSTFGINTSSTNDTTGFLWELFNIALQSRQTGSHVTYPYPLKYHGKYPEYYQNYPDKYNRYPGSTYHHDKNHYSSHKLYRPKSIDHFSKPSKESLMKVLYSIVKNDDRQCVPKLICELASGTMSGRQQGLNLPVNINMESILGFLSTLNGVQTAPLLHFGKAAILGVSSKGNTGSCNYAYPDCPSDPDKVVKYLNNHNGGFFRFFSGVTPVRNYQVPHWQNSFPEQRILNTFANYAPSYESSITFPNREEEEIVSNYELGEKDFLFPTSNFVYNNEISQLNDEPLSYTYSSLKFPNEDYDQSFRKPKELLYNNFERPLPNHKASPMIFPVRTGTGNLRLDPEELQDYEKPTSHLVFTADNYDENYNRNGKRINFPDY